VSREFRFDEIYKGFIIPIRGANDEPQYVKVITLNDAAELFKNMNELIEGLLKEFLKMRGITKLVGVEDLRDFLDFFVLFIKNILYLDVVPGVIPSPIKTFHYYIPLRNKKELSTLDLFSLDGLKKFEESTSTIYYNVDWSVEEKLKKDVEKALHYPADTRPLANVSSLLLHSLVVSAFASCKYLAVNKKFEKKIDDKTLVELTALRLASLFHDFGKYNFRNWHNHEEYSIKFLEGLKNQYSEDRASEVIDLAISIIKGNELYLRYYKEADRVASAIDRIKDIFCSLVEKDDIKKKIDEAARRMGKSWSDIYELYDNWEFWEILGQENIREITERFCKMLSNISIENPVIKELVKLLSESRKKENKDILIAKIDLRAIQKYIHANDIRTMKGASRVIDILIMLSIPNYLYNEFNIPYECFLIHGGGNVTFIIPEPIKEQIRDELHKIEEKFGIDIAYAYTNLDSNFSLSDSILTGELSKEKATLFKPESIIPNIFRVCSYCGYKFAEKKIENDYVCSVCLEKRDIGNEYHYKELGPKLNIETNPPKGEKFLEHILEYIGGLNIEELTDLEEYLNIGFVRVDGNLIGQFMSTAVSITDAFERSIRIDTSLKKAFHTFLNEVKKKDEEDYKRIILGVVYMGGDDASLLVPSKLAIPLAYTLVNEYFLNMGCKSTLSAGIAIAKPKHPIMYLYESAGYILKFAKSKSREEALSIHQSLPTKNSFRGSLSLFVVEQGTMLPENIDYVLDTIHKERISVLYEKPFMIIERSRDNSILRYFEFLMDQNIDNPDSLTLPAILNKIYDENFIKKLKDIRDALLKTLQISINNDSSLHIKIMFSKREELTNDKEKGTLFGRILNNLLYLRNGKEMFFTLYDLYLFLESFLGGVKKR
jgi:hypothetical protein